MIVDLKVFCSCPVLFTLSHSFFSVIVVLAAYKLAAHKKEVCIPNSNHMFNANSRNTETRCEICSSLTIKTPEQHGRRSGVFIFNFEHVSYIIMVFLFLTLNM